MSYGRSSKPKVNELSLELKDVVKNWDVFALELPGITPTHLHSAEADRPNNQTRQKLYVYEKWLNVCPEASWSHVVDALNKADRQDLAKQLGQKLIPPMTPAATPSTQSVPPSGNVITIMLHTGMYAT